VKRRAIAIALLIAVIVIYSVGIYHRYSEYDQFMNELYAFRQLGQIARARIDAQAATQGTADPGYYIFSYEEFFSYVAMVRPDAVSTRDAENPFPGILPSHGYKHLNGPATAPSDELIWSDRTFRRPSGDIRIRLTCNGNVVLR
jgi:hypothetical protein